MKTTIGSLTDQKTFTVALVGQPNTGKSTVFNQLTGASQHVGNWPGKTIEKKHGSFNYQSTLYHVVDLPGTYSLTANSLEEKVSRDFIINERPDLLIVVLDASQLERTMYMLVEVLPLSVPVIAALNMMDVAEHEGCRIDVKCLEKAVELPVIPMIASKKKGMEELVEVIHSLTSSQKRNIPSILENTGLEKVAYEQIKTHIINDTLSSYPIDWLIIKLMEGDEEVSTLVKNSLSFNKWQNIKSIINQFGDGALNVAEIRYDWINKITGKAVNRPMESVIKIRRGRFDKVATHPIWGAPLAVMIILVGFAAAMVIAMPVMMLALKSLPHFINFIRSTLIDLSDWIVSMLADGLLPGVGMALAFLGFLFSMFLIIGFVEDTGYLARVAFISDRFMSRIGLHGKSFLPMLTSFGCNVAGVLGSRVVDSTRQRLMTLVMAPIVPCMAVWGVIGFFGTLFFGVKAFLIILVLFFLLISWLIFTGFLFKRLLLKEESSGLIMELPPYHKPNWKTIMSFTWGHTKSFIMRGMTLIAGASVVIWALSYFPNGNIETSFLGIAGRAMEPLGHLLGLDWRLLVALIASMASKEAALATLGVLYGLSSGAGTTSLTGLFMGAKHIEQSAIASAIHVSISPASALAFMFAVFFSVPCLGTLGAIYSETRSLKWTLGATFYYTFAALFAGFLAYRVGLLIL